MFPKGYKHPEWVKDKIKRSSIGKHKGSKNSRWKGGITPINKVIRYSEKYKLWRKAVFERDDYNCVWCGKRGFNLEADHIIAFSSIINKIKFEQGIENLYEKAMECELLWDVNNGRTLCVDCHKKTENYKGKSLKRH